MLTAIFSRRNAYLTSARKRTRKSVASGDGTESPVFYAVSALAFLAFGFWIRNH